MRGEHQHPHHGGQEASRRPAGSNSPAGLERTDADLKIALDDLVARLTESNQAVDKADGPAFAEAGGLIATAFRNAQRAELALLK
jgi:hypothetical protein